MTAHSARMAAENRKANRPYPKDCIASFIPVRLLSFCQPLEGLEAFRADGVLHPAGVCRRCFPIYAQILQQRLEGLMPFIGGSCDF